MYYNTNFELQRLEIFVSDAVEEPDLEGNFGAIASNLTFLSIHWQSDVSVELVIATINAIPRFNQLEKLMLTWNIDMTNDEIVRALS